MQENYREYIELWLHKIKTPLAWGMLSFENAESQLCLASFEIMDVNLAGV